MYSAFEKFPTVVVVPPDRSVKFKSDAVVPGHVLFSTEKRYLTRSQREPAIKRTVLIQLIGDVLTSVTDQNEALFTPSELMAQEFNCKETPTVTITGYLHEIMRCLPSPCVVLILLVIYLDRLSKAPNPPVINRRNVFALVIVMYTVATKQMCDEFYRNADYAHVGRIHLSTLNVIELDFLFKVKFALDVTPVEYNSYMEAIYLFAYQMGCVCSCAYGAGFGHDMVMPQTRETKRSKETSDHGHFSPPPEMSCAVQVNAALGCYDHNAPKPYDFRAAGLWGT